MSDEADHKSDDAPKSDAANAPREALPLEEPEPARDEREEIPCPNCGSPMRGDDAILCLRCGYDMKSMKVTDTTSKGTDTDEDEVPEDDAGSTVDLVRPGAGNHVLPIALLAIAALGVIVGLLVGMPGLYPPLPEGETSIGWPERFEALARYAVTIALWTVCTMGALLAGAWLFGRPFGDARLALSRVLGIVAVAQTVRFLALPWRWVEITLEFILMAIVFAVLAIAFFRVSLRDALTLLGLTIASFVFLALAASIISWAI